MSKESILNKLTICPVCHKAYLASIDVCDCLEEQKVSEWEDVTNSALLGKFQSGEITL